MIALIIDIYDAIKRRSSEVAFFVFPVLFFSPFSPMLHNMIIAIETDTPLLTQPGDRDESRILAKAFRSLYYPSVFNPTLIYIYDIYSYYLSHTDAALDEFRAEAIRANPDRKELIENMKMWVVRYERR